MSRSLRSVEAARVPRIAVDVARVLVVAACLRPALTAVGPVLPDIGADLGLGTTALGLLGALPLLCFAAASPLVHALTRRTGTSRAATVALVGLAVAVLVRSVPVSGALWAGTALVGLTIAVGNVVVPAVVKRDFHRHPALVTGVYVAVMGTCAALASGLSAPLADRLGGWRPGLAVWALPIGLAALAWATTGRRHPAEDRDRQTAPRATGGGRSPWRTRLGWQVTALMGLQSLTFYLLVTWLPSMSVAAGSTPATAGWHLFAYQAVGVAAGPAAAALADRTGTSRVLWAGPGALLALTALGALAAPGLAPLWVLLAGVASGASFVLALAAVPLRTGTPEEAVRLSGMAQSVGYLVAATGPVAAGWLVGGRAGWAGVLVVVALVATAQAVVGLRVAGRDHRHASATPGPAQDGPGTPPVPEEDR